MDASNVDKSALEIFAQKFFILFPPDSLLSWILFIIFTLVLIYLYLLPKRIHDEAIVKLEKKLDVDLKLLENNLNEKLDHLNIIRAQVEPKKIETYIKLVDFFGDIITKKKKPSPQQSQSFFYDFGTKLFFFASDATIRKYLDLRKLVFSKENQILPGQLKNPEEATQLYAELILSMRKDLGYSETNCTPNDLIKIVTVDEFVSA